MMRITEEMIRQARLRAAAAQIDVPVECVTFESYADPADEIEADLGDALLNGDIPECDAWAILVGEKSMRSA
jgi:hypothetical protein